MGESRRPSSAWQTDGYIAVALASAEPYSDAEYLTILLAAATQARDAGDYGIAAALVIRHQGLDLALGNRRMSSA